METVHKLHGLPSSIIMECNRIFISKLWKELLKALGVRVNQCVEAYLRYMRHQRLKKWSKWLCLFEVWYNTNFHCSIKIIPFQALYGYPPPQFNLRQFNFGVSVELSTLLEVRRKMVHMFKENLKLAQQYMKHYVDKNRSERVFEVGDEFYLELQPYKQNSVVLRRTLKLASKYYGPYKVLAKVAYKLALLPTALHTLSYMSPNLRKRLDISMLLVLFPDMDMEGNFKIYPIDVLDKRLIPKNNVVVPQIFSSLGLLYP
ncbi:hypothetical protein BUALT_Bualt13G0072000 [Buddleja alternifolia]|uniref:Uncharacterized protein n=1 Tax=Buddleja alternifolia TaxID=168488 RepID=A0AAV6WMG7_9LAMI|nr:hypothetical protein BUALT_Bualt13G0072000 [Buddleja alternifolia]